MSRTSSCWGAEYREVFCGNRGSRAEECRRALSERGDGAPRSPKEGGGRWVYRRSTTNLWISR